MKPGAILLARLDSTRLPGKPLRKFAGRPLLDWLLDRARGVAECVLATSDRPVDDPLVEFAASRNLACFRGDVDDVAGRVLGAADQQGFTHFFRLNGDSPCVVPELARRALALMESDPTLDFVTNLRPRTYPYGVACELFRTDSFRAGYARMTEPGEREHVTPFFYEHPADFRFGALTYEDTPLDHVRLTVDTGEDALFFEQLFLRAGDRWTSWTLPEITNAAAAIRTSAIS